MTSKPARPPTATPGPPSANLPDLAGAPDVAPRLIGTGDYRGLGTGFLLEMPPTVFLTPVGERYYRVHMPYLVALAVPRAYLLHLRARRAPLERRSDRLLVLRWPHQGSDGRCCLNPHPGFRQIPDTVEAAIGLLTSYFHDGSRYYLVPYHLQGRGPWPTRLATFDRYQSAERIAEQMSWWEKLSPEKVLKLPFADAETLEQFVGVYGKATIKDLPK